MTTTAAALTEEHRAPYSRAVELARSLGGAAVAFSAGVDSTLALRLCADALGDRCVAVTARSASLAPEELDDARRFARDLGVRLVEVPTREIALEGYRSNTRARCYVCKTELYSKAREVADLEGLQAVVDGTNADDLRAVDRPGNAAAERLGVRSLLAEAGLGKRDVRELARALGLEAWDKPAMACLSSRIPFGTEITETKLAQVARAETALRELGFRGARVRHHGELARLELREAELPRALEPEVRAELARALRSTGFSYVTLDLEGYRPGGSRPSAPPTRGPATSDEPTSGKDSA
jgi:uncharacterized protein